MFLANTIAVRGAAPLAFRPLRPRRQF